MEKVKLLPYYMNFKGPYQENWIFLLFLNKKSFFPAFTETTLQKYIKRYILQT